METGFRDPAAVVPPECISQRPECDSSTQDPRDDLENPMSAFQEKLNSLTQRFLLTLPNRVGSISRLLLRIHGQPLDPRILVELGSQFHALSGTAGTYGIMDVAALATEAEAICDGAGIEESDLEYMGSLVRDLHDLVERIVSTEMDELVPVREAEGGLR